MTEKRRALRIGIVLLALCAGALFPFSLAPSDRPLAGVLSVALLCVLVQGHGGREIFWRGLWYGIGLFGVGASWVYVSIHVYGEAPSWLAGIFTGLFVVLLALCLAVPLMLLAAARRLAPLPWLFVFPSVWVLAEWFRGWFLTGFPWLYLGYGHLDSWLAGWAPLGGVLALSWLAAFTAAALAQLRFANKRNPQLLVGLAMVALGWLVGAGLADRDWTAPAASPVRVALVQPALPLNVKWDQYELSGILDGYRETSDRLWHNDLVIWPESAIPELHHRVAPYLADLNDRALASGSALITGIPTLLGDRYYNSVLALGAGEGLYHKRRLVPFGEYVPLEEWLRGTIRFFDLPMSAFSRGPAEQPLLRAAGLSIGTAICYEIVYQDLVAHSSPDADILLTVSNDTWFGSSAGPHQHFQMARMRALENGKPVLRGTNDGITAIIDSRGRVQASLPQFETGVLEGKVMPHSGATPFSRLGSWPVVALSALLLALGAAASRRIARGLQKTAH